jgi:hypothetical protein
LIREGLKTPVTEEVALAVDGERRCLDHVAGNCADAGVRQATATVV